MVAYNLSGRIVGLHKRAKVVDFSAQFYIVLQKGDSINTQNGRFTAPIQGTYFVRIENNDLATCLYVG